jgi:hypothetical protein
MATNNAANIGTAASGKVLQGAGVGVAPTFSTPTYPSASGTSRKILVSDGTNNVYSTETWATPSTSGNVLTSDGTNWTSAAAPAGNLLVATKTLTSAQIKAIHATPIEIIAAPGAGKGIFVINYSAKLVYGGTNPFTAAASQTIGLYFNNNTTSHVTGTNLIANAMITNTANAFTRASSVTGFGNQAAGTLDNVNLAAYNSVATEISGNAAGNNTINITVYYTVVTF